jgi:hypothetical protein
MNGRSLAARPIRTSEINVKQAYLELLRLRRLVREARKDRFHSRNTKRVGPICNIDGEI